MGMYGPNDALGAAGYTSNNGCMGIALILFVVGAGIGTGLLFLL